VFPSLFQVIFSHPAKTTRFAKPTAFHTLVPSAAQVLYEKTRNS